MRTYTYSRSGVAKRLRELRLAFGYTQNQFAEITGRCVGTIRKFERGLKDIDIYSFQRIADETGSSWGFIIEGFEDRGIAHQVKLNLEDPHGRSYILEAARVKRTGELYGRQKPVVV